MTEYTHDVFYEVNHLDFEDLQDLIRDAYEKCYSWRADEIKGGGQRQPIDATFEEQLSKMNKSSLFRFIHRKGFPEDEWNKWRIEIVFNEMLHFLWVEVEEEHLPYFIEYYKLIPMG